MEPKRTFLLVGGVAKACDRSEFWTMGIGEAVGERGCGKVWITGEREGATV